MLEFVVSAALGASSLFRPQDIAVPPSVDEARAICIYDDSAHVWRCDAGDLAHFRIETVETRSPVEGATVGVRALRLAQTDQSLCRAALHLNAADAARETLRCLAEQTREMGCPLAAELTIANATDRVLVDWNQVAFTVDGRARQTLPGFAKQMTSALVQRPSVAPVGSTLVESVFSADTTCLVGREPPYDAPGDELTLVVPIQIGDEKRMMEWKSVRRWVPIDEKTLFALVPAPPEAASPGAPPPPSTTPERTPWAVSLGVPGGVAAVLGTGAFCSSCFVPANGPRWGLGSDDTARLTLGLCIGGSIVNVAGLCALAVAVGLDVSAASEEDAARLRARQAEETYLQKKSEADFMARMRAAYFAKRDELGLPAIPTSQPEQAH